ncbi:MAG TPA: hypothetical protein VGP92_14965 [Acidimicrobiia bacterium]|nr:hypothetical protein [Acidimicrobiia bacterium]
MKTSATPRRSGRFGRVVARASLTLAVGLAVVPVTAGTASAGLLSPIVSTLLPSCAPRPTSTAFQQWGDSSNYFLMPNGGFESGTSGWVTTPGVGIASDNESFHINGANDAHSLTMGTAQVVASPTVCVSMGENTIRMFVKGSGVATSVLHVQAFVQNRLTGLVLSTGFDIRGTAGVTGWAPSPRMYIPNLLGGVLATQNLTLVFSTSGPPATWNIDDVYVDPFKSR